MMAKFMKSSVFSRQLLEVGLLEKTSNGGAK